MFKFHQIGEWIGGWTGTHAVEFVAVVSLMMNLLWTMNKDEGQFIRWKFRALLLEILLFSLKSNGNPFIFIEIQWKSYCFRWNPMEILLFSFQWKSYCFHWNPIEILLFSLKSNENPIVFIKIECKSLCFHWNPMEILFSCKSRTLNFKSEITLV